MTVKQGVSFCKTNMEFGLYSSFSELITPN